MTDAATLNQSNAERKALKLRKKIERQHDWRVEVWASNEQRIQKMQAELEALGEERVRLFKPDFTDPNMLDHYAKGAHAQGA